MYKEKENLAATRAPSIVVPAGQMTRVKQTNRQLGLGNTARVNDCHLEKFMKLFDQSMTKIKTSYSCTIEHR